METLAKKEIRMKLHCSKIIASAVAIVMAFVIAFCFYGFSLVYLYKPNYILNIVFWVVGFVILFLQTVSVSFLRPEIAKAFTETFFFVVWCICGLIVICILPLSMYTQSNAGVPILLRIESVLWDVMPLLAILATQHRIQKSRIAK